MFNINNTNSLLLRRNLCSYTYLISHLIDKNAHELRISLFPAKQVTALGRMLITYYPPKTSINTEMIAGIIN
jgi:hypothetical protein